MTPSSIVCRPFGEDTKLAYTATSRFSTRTLSTDMQILAWRQRVGHVVDVPPSSTQLIDGFAADIDFYAVGGMVFTDCRTPPMVLERSVARVSTDTRRDYAFHLFLEGSTGHVTGMRQKRSATSRPKSIVAFDMNQPFRVDRPACRVLTLFVPRAIVDAGLSDSESIHGRMLPTDTLLGRLAWDHMAAIGNEIAGLGAHDALDGWRAGAELLLAGFQKSSHLAGGHRAAVQAAVIGKVRRFVEAHLHQSDLTPTYVVDALQLKRATIYRWFEREGGLGAYIRYRRLRTAADELVRFAHLPVIEIAYGLGFKSASDFTRAFRRAFSMSPKDMRAQALALRQTPVTR